MSWLKLHPKIKAAGIALVGVWAGAVAAAANGTTTWRDAALTGIAASLPVVAGYLKSA